MAFDGAGTFLRMFSWVVDATNNVKIRADRHDQEDNNFAAGLSNCICKDGQTAITQNIPWNSRRITALADPVNAQDAATKAYADTKVALDGSTPMTGNLTVTGNITSTGTVTATGYQTRSGQNGAYTGHYFNFDWNGSNLEAWVDGSDIGAVATQAYVASQVNTRLPLSGGTITGSLTVNGSESIGSNLQVGGEIGTTSNIYRFGAVGSSGAYLQWNGGGTYTLGGGGTVWHSGNLNPSTGLTQDVQLAMAGEVAVAIGFPSGPMNEPFPGAAITGWTWTTAGGVAVTGAYRFRYVQVKRGGTWFTVGTA